MADTKSATMRQRAYDAIVNRILAGKYRPGDLLNRRSLAEQLGMSAGPVHQALLHLEREGLVEALPRVGTRIKQVSVAYVRDHLMLREALECQAARLACEKPGSVKLDGLWHTADELDRSEPDDQRTAVREVKFHTAMVKLADCQPILKEYQRVMQVACFFQTLLILTAPSRMPPRFHTVLVRAIAEKDPDRAEASVRYHIRSGYPDLFANSSSANSKMRLASLSDLTAPKKMEEPS